MVNVKQRKEKRKKNLKKIKDSIIDALKEENMKHQSRVQQLEDKLLEIKVL